MWSALGTAPGGRGQQAFPVKDPMVFPAVRPLRLGLCPALAGTSSCLVWRVENWHRVCYQKYSPGKRAFIQHIVQQDVEKEMAPTPVLLPGESQGRGSLVGCCLWGRTESDTTAVT